MCKVLPLPLFPLFILKLGILQQFTPYRIKNIWHGHGHALKHRKRKKKTKSQVVAKFCDTHHFYNFIVIKFPRLKV